MYPFLAVVVVVGHLLMGAMRQGDDDDAVDMMHVDAADITFWERIVKKRDVSEVSFLCVCPA